MAKKRKTSGRSAQVPAGPNLDVGESKKRIRDYRDVADSDDEFHDARDQLLLDDGPDAKRRRKWEDEEEFLQASEEEVLGYSDSASDQEEEELQTVPKSKSTRNSGADTFEGSDSEQDASRNGEDDEEAELGWGTSRADFYGADAIETEEQALEEEAEALRIQRKQLQSMSAEDYGFDKSDWIQDKDATIGHAEQQDEGTVIEVLPAIQIHADMTVEDRRKMLRSRYPEFDPLSQELLRMRKFHSALVTQDLVNKPNATIKEQAAFAYLGTLVMYFALLASPAWNNNDEATALPANKLREHAVMDNLVQSRALWQKVSQLPDDIPVKSDVEIEIDEDVPLEDNSPDFVPVPKTKPRLSRAERHAAAARAEAKAKRQARLESAELDLADLDALVANAGLRKGRDKPSKLDDNSDLGEEAPLTAYEVAQKANKKKSLRFYTSQIAQKQNKRGASGRNAGGDEDIPYRERWRDRQARLNAEAENRGRSNVRDELGGESDDGDAEQAKQIRAAADPYADTNEDEEGYYDMIAARTSKKKADKVAFAAAQKEAAAQGGRVVEEETIGADGKRKISYAIEKNKGLTPFRKKDVRNPRVKKRKKYDEKKKKLASIKPIYKGGEGRGGYGGELTGIKKGLVKSTKL